MSAGATDPATQLQGDWKLSHLAGAALPDGIDGTMTFTPAAVSISLGCNTISAVPMYQSSGVFFRDVTQTEMACDADVAALEAQVMTALQSVEALKVGAGDDLSFYDALNTLQLGARRRAQ